MQTVSLAKCVPDGIVSAVRGYIGHTAAGTASPRVALASAATGSLHTGPSPQFGLQYFLGAPNGTAARSMYAAAPFEVIVKTSQQIAWGAAVTTQTCTMRTTGYRLRE